MQVDFLLLFRRKRNQKFWTNFECDIEVQNMSKPGANLGFLGLSRGIDSQTIIQKLVD